MKQPHENFLRTPLQMAITFNCHGTHGSRRRGKEKTDKKEILFGLL